MLNKGVDTLVGFLDGSLAERQERLITKLRGYLDTSEFEPILRNGGNILAIACAGAGKTTLLVIKIIYDSLSYDANERILVTTFLKSGAADINSVYLEWCKKLGVRVFPNIEFKTLHSAFYSILTRLGVSIRPNEEGRKSVMREWLIAQRLVDKKTVNIEERLDFDLLLTYTANSIAPVTKHVVLTKYGISSARWAVVYADFIKRKRDKSVYDFDDIQTLLYSAYKKNPDVALFASRLYTRLYIDEAQDTSDIQYALLRPLLDAAKSFLIVGDDDQTIYSWRGSNIDIILRYVRSHYVVDLGFLTVNRRCPEGVLAPVIPCISTNTKRFEKKLCACTGGGRSVLHTYGSFKSMDRTLAELNALCLEAYDTQTSMLITSRTNNALSIPILYFADLGYDFRIAGAGINPTIGSVFATLLNALSLFDSNGRVSKDALTLLALPMSSMRLFQSILANNRASIFDIDAEELSAYPLVHELVHRVQSTDSVYSKLRCLFTYIRMHYFRDRASSYCDSVYALFTFTLTCLAKDVENMHELRQRVNNMRNNIDVALRSSSNVVFSTIHEAKGKTYDYTVIWNVSEGVFASGGSSAGCADSAEIEEERRLLYIAWTRSRVETHVFASIIKPSPFLLECDLFKIENGMEFDTAINNMREQAAMGFIGL